MASISACGDCLPPFLIFKGKLTPDVSKFPDGTSIQCSPSGYIDQDIFLKFLQHFNEHRVHVEGKKCLLFVDGHKSHVTIEAAEFCVEQGIELICLPPHTTHRLQPLDTHYNKILKQKWADILSRYLSADGSTLSLPREKFHCVFNKVWEEMTQRRGLIVDAFAHCGLFPAKNTVEEREYEKAKIFKTEGNAVSYQDGDSNMVLLRTIVSSPKIKPNRTHERPHATQITSPENVLSLNRKLKEKISKIEQRKSKFVPMKLKIRLGRSTSHIDQPGTSTGATNNEHEASECCVCGASWEATSEDWFRCTICEGWACETCFAMDVCADCS